MTVEEQVVDTSKTQNTVDATVDTLQTQNVAEAKPYRTFQTQEEFDRHSAGILNNAKGKAERELLAMLGLKPDEKDKLAKFKEAYEASLDEGERKAKELESLSGEVKSLKDAVSEKDAVISALSKLTDRTADDAVRLVRMAKGLVDADTSMEQAMEQVLAFAQGSGKAESKVGQRQPPKGEPLSEPDVKAGRTEDNPFRTGNLTEQGRLIRKDRDKAREMYVKVHGTRPNW